MKPLKGKRVDATVLPAEFSLLGARSACGSGSSNSTVASHRVSGGALSAPAECHDRFPGVEKALGKVGIGFAAGAVIAPEWTARRWGPRKRPRLVKARVFFSECTTGRDWATVPADRSPVLSCCGPGALRVSDALDSSPPDPS